MESSRAPAARAARAPTGCATLVPGLRPPAAHAGAHLHARRPLRATHRAPTSARSPPTGATSRRSTRRAPTASATSRTTTTSCGRRPRWRAGSGAALAAAHAAWPAACGPRRATAARASCSSTRCCRSSRGCASALARRCSRTRCRPTAPSPTRCAIWHYARGTALREDRPPRRGARRARAPRRARRRPGAGARSRSRTSTRRPRCVRIARLTLQADIALAEGRLADAVRAAARRRPRSRTASRTTSRTCGSRRRATRSARRCSPPGARRGRARLPRGPRATTPTTAGRWPAWREALRAAGRADEARAAQAQARVGMAPRRRPAAELALLTRTPAVRRRPRRLRALRHAGPRAAARYHIFTFIAI